MGTKEQGYKQAMSDISQGKKPANTEKMNPEQRDGYLKGVKDAQDKTKKK